MGDQQEAYRQPLHHVAVHRHFQAAAIPHLVVDLQNNLDSDRDLDCSTPDLKWEESRRVVLGYYSQSMAEAERRCTELGRARAVAPLLPSPSLDKVHDQGGDVAAL